jgi:hypothetical protein
MREVEKQMRNKWKVVAFFIVHLEEGIYDSIRSAKLF